MQTSVRIERKNENLNSTRAISFCPKIDKNRKQKEQITIWRFPSNIVEQKKK